MVGASSTNQCFVRPSLKWITAQKIALHESNWRSCPDNASRNNSLWPLERRHFPRGCAVTLTDTPTLAFPLRSGSVDLQQSTSVFTVSVGRGSIGVCKPDETMIYLAMQCLPLRSAHNLESTDNLRAMLPSRLDPLTTPIQLTSNEHHEALTHYWRANYVGAAAWLACRDVITHIFLTGVVRRICVG